MNKVILLNSGKEEEGSNFFKTIKNTVDLFDLRNFFDEYEFERIASTINNAFSTQVWAVSEKSNPGNFIKGDRVLFCANNTYHTVATIDYTLKEPNKALARYLWETDKHVYIFFLKNVKTINFSRGEIQTLVGMKSNFTLFSSKILDEQSSEKVLKYLTKSWVGSGNGADAQSDKIASVDKLGRSKLIDNLSDFYKEYARNSSNPFFIGIFGGWGRGKSSFVEMLIQSIKKDESPNHDVVHVVSKIDTSLMDKKDAVWLSILSKVIDDVEEQKTTSKMFKGIISRWNFRKPWNLNKLNATKMQFNAKNLMRWAWIKKGVLFTYALLSILSVSAIILWIGPAQVFSLDGKTIASWLTVITLIITMIKTIESKAGSILLTSHNKNRESLFFKSKDEFKQLIKILNKNLKKDKTLRILVVLDEVDRMNKELITELIEVIQLFKGIQELDSVEKKGLGSKKKENKVTLNFMFSFNHEIVFPSIGNAISQGEKELLVDSFSKNMISDSVEKSINRYRLGKEYMDKYLDLSIYLDGQMDLNSLINSLFSEQKEESKLLNKIDFNDYIDQQIEKFTSSSHESSQEVSTSKLSKEQEDVISEEVNNDREGGFYKEGGNEIESIDTSESILPTFTIEEINIIREECIADIDPRKIIRLKNTLILLRMLNDDIQSDQVIDRYHEELREFVKGYLNNEYTEKTENDFSILKGKDFFMDKKRYAPSKEKEDKVEKAV